VTEAEVTAEMGSSEFESEIQAEQRELNAVQAWAQSDRKAKL